MKAIHEAIMAIAIKLNMCIIMISLNVKNLKCKTVLCYGVCSAL